MLSALLRRILRRREAYRRVFQIEDGKVGNQDAETVLADLRRFCNASKATYRVSPVSRMVDEKAMLIAEGRREVWLRIEQFLHINDADLARLEEQQERTHDTEN